MKGPKKAYMLISPERSKNLIPGLTLSGRIQIILEDKPDLLEDLVLDLVWHELDSNSDLWEVRAYDWSGDTLGLASRVKLIRKANEYIYPMIPGRDFHDIDSSTIPGYRFVMRDGSGPFSGQGDSPIQPNLEVESDTGIYFTPARTDRERDLGLNSQFDNFQPEDWDGNPLDYDLWQIEATDWEPFESLGSVESRAKRLRYIRKAEELRDPSLRENIPRDTSFDAKTMRQRLRDRLEQR